MSFAASVKEQQVAPPNQARNLKQTYIGFEDADLEAEYTANIIHPSRLDWFYFLFAVLCQIIIFQSFTQSNYRRIRLISQFCNTSCEKNAKDKVYKATLHINFLMVSIALTHSLISYFVHWKKYICLFKYLKIDKDSVN